MIDMSENKSIEETEHVPDRAVIDFRRTVRGKKKETTESEKSEKRKNILREIVGLPGRAVRRRCLR